MANVWLNGALIDEDEAKIPALDRGVLNGWGVFETLRAYSGKLWAFDEHYDRLNAGSAFLDIKLIDKETLRSATTELLKAEGLSDAGVRFTVTAGSGPTDAHSDPTGDPNVLISAWPLRDYTKMWRDGVSLVSVREWGRAMPGVKSISYAPSVAGRIAAAKAGADDALFVGRDDEVFEASGSNLMAVFGERLATPIVDGVLPGVTRKLALELAEEIGLKTKEVLLRLDDLFEADEVLLTSSLREVYSVREIDGRRLSRGMIATRLRGALRARVRENLSI